MQDRKFTDISTAITPARSHAETPRPVPALTVISHPTPQRAGEQLLLTELARGESVAHRLAGYEIRVPPLRERREDIGVLFFHMVQRLEVSKRGLQRRLKDLGLDKS